MSYGRRRSDDPEGESFEAVVLSELADMRTRLSRIEGGLALAAFAATILAASGILAHVHFGA